MSIAPLAARVGVCEMCLVGQEQLRTAVLVQHLRGGAVELAACDRCAAAMRRLLAVAGSAGPSGPVYVGAETLEPESMSELVPAETAARDTVGEPVLLYEYSEPFRADTGQSFAVRVYGQERSDGTWIGWLTFVGFDGQVRRTARETTQSTREHLVYWATGLEQSFLEGAFNRATCAQPGGGASRRANS
jgi:hypothetical protein